MSPEPELLRLRPLRAVAAPFRERRFTYAAYGAFLASLAADPRVAVVPLREYEGASRAGVVIGMRHDVDDRLDSALAFGRLEHRHGIRSTYFVLHTASYYRHDDAFLAALHVLQDELGHEIGWHNDLLTLQLLHGVDAVEYLHGELNWLRANGIDVVGTAAHGSRACHELGFTNRYFFSDFPDVDPTLPNKDAVVVAGVRVPIRSAPLSAFGLVYEATQLPRDLYFSDAAFDEAGRRRHPQELHVGELRAGATAIALTHPCLWDSSPAARVLRESARLARRAVTLAGGRRS